MEFTSLRPRLERTRTLALAVGVVGLILCAVGAFADTTQFFQSYLYGFLFWWGLSMGGLAAVMLHHMVGGGWGALIRRLMETSAMLIPLMAVLFLPILIFGLDYIYPWSLPSYLETHPIVARKAPYLNDGFFIIRAVIYFAIWITMALLLNRWSLQEDRQHSPVLTHRFKQLSAPGLVIYVLTVTFAAFDWGMSLEPEWFSSIYGVIFIVGQGLSALTSAILLLRMFGAYRPLSDEYTTTRLHDISKLLFAFVVLWTYINLSQFLIIYSANLAEEATWYEHRNQGGWQYFTFFLVVVQFVTPFFILLSRRTKQTLTRMAWVAGALLFIRLIDLFWLIKPSFYQDAISISWLDIATVVGIGGIWVAAYITVLLSRPVLASNSFVLRNNRATSSAHGHSSQAASH